MGLLHPSQCWNFTMNTYYFFLIFLSFLPISFFLLLLFKDVLFFFLCVYMCLGERRPCVYWYLKNQKRVLDPLTLELQTIGNHPLCRLGIELRS